MSSVCCVCRSFFLGALLGFVLAPAALGVEPRSWPLTTPAQYSVSDSNDIQVAGGVARLQFSDLSFSHGELDQYSAGSTAGAALYYGADTSLGLRKDVGLYAAGSQFTSRVIASPPGNLWKAIRIATSSDTVANNNEIETRADLDGLAALYHFNDDGVYDSVTGSNGVMKSGAGYDTDAVFGSHAFAGYLGNGVAELAGTGILHLAEGATIACWVKVREEFTRIGTPEFMTPFLMNGATKQLTFRLKSMYHPFLFTSCTTEFPIEVGKWYFLAGTYDRADGYVRLYIDGHLQASGTRNQPGWLVRDDAGPWTVGYNHPYIDFKANVDEVMLFRRAFSALEIEALYRQGLGVKVQVRSGASTNLVSAFVGPDGTNSTYVTGGHALNFGYGFDPSAPYLQYRAYIANAVERTSTPLLDSVVFLGTGTDLFDDTLGDFTRGAYGADVVTYPAEKTGSFLGLSKLASGGYRTEGAFISQPLDAGGIVTWTKLSWVQGNRALANDIVGLLGLWPMDGSWSDISGNNRSGTETPSVVYTPYAKVGTKSTLFNGEDASVSIGGVGSVKTLEFWIDYDDPNGGLFELVGEATGPSATVILTNGWLQVNNWAGSVDVYVNGYNGAAVLESGWNHVALVVDAAQSVSNMVVGQIQGDYFHGKLDDLAAFDRPLAAGEIAMHYQDGLRESAGQVVFQVRSGDTTEELEGSAFTGTYTGGAGSDLFGQSGRYLQYKINMSGDGNGTPSVQSVRVNYNVIFDVSETRAEDFSAGTFVDEETRWYGNEIAKENLGSIGPFNARPTGDTSWKGLWHMDEEVWAAGLTVKDSSGNSRDGSPQGDARTEEKGRVGTRCGLFDGAEDYVSLQAIPTILDKDFTLGLWFKTSSTNRAGLISNFDGVRYWSLEINGDGSGAEVQGAASFIIDDTTVEKSAAAVGMSLNDGYWHHIAGVRRSPYIHLYIDGARVASTWIGDAYSFLGIGAPLVAKYGTSEIYYAGYIDEVAVLERAMSDAEVGALAGVGRGLGSGAEFIGTPIDAGRVSIWRQISWGADGPHGTPLQAGDTTLTGLWHLDEVSGAAMDSSGAGNDGSVNGAGYGGGGVFSNSFEFSGGATISVVGSLGLVTSVTAEAWINTHDPRGAVVFDRTDGVSGFMIGLDGEGRPYFKMGAVEARSDLPLQVDRWSHLAGTYDGSMARLYMDGVLRAAQKVIGVSADSGTSFVIGDERGGGSRFIGQIDEAAVHNRTLVDEEIRDHYRSGTGDIRFQVRGGDTLPLSGDFIGPDGTANSYFREFWGSQTAAVLPVQKYLQYRAVMDNDNHRMPAVLRGVQADVTSYSTVNPWVEPADGFGYDFVGRLTSFGHALGVAGPNTEVRYQLSGDNGVNWFYWNDTALQWDAPAGFGYPLDMSDEPTVAANIGSFFDQLYPTNGGILKFRAFLHSEGDYQIELDEVNLQASTGRLLVTQPNGLEVGQDAWVIGTTNIISWANGGSVGGSLKIQFSDDGGQTWKLVNAAVPNSGPTGAYAWVTPGTELASERNQCRIRISDNGDATIWDTSDANFALVYRYRLTAPNGGEVWYTGEPNVIRWQSPPGLGDQADLYYNLNGFNQLNGAGWRKFATVPNNNLGSADNMYTWVTPKDDPDLISSLARVRITIQGAVSFSDMSDASYTMAGIRITDPSSSTAWKRGSTQTVKWKAAGSITNGVTLEYSGDSGASWTNVQAVVPCVVGSNTYAWTIAADNPTPNARLRMVSRTEPRIFAESDIFTVADIDIKAPVAAQEWQTLQTNDIVWTAGGAGDKVNLYYSIDNAASWVGIDLDVDNVDFPATNRYAWVVPDLPGDSLIRIQSTLSAQLFADSPLFKIAGIRVTQPNGGARWELAQESQLNWVEAASGGGCLVQFSYDGGNSYVNLAGPGFPLLARSYAYTPITPTVRALVKVSATDAAYALLGVKGQSDGDFTVAGVKVTSPLQDHVIKMGVETVEAMRWLSAGLLDDSVDVIYSDGTTETTLFAGTFNNESFNDATHISGLNVRDWIPAASLNPSGNARLKVMGGVPETTGEYTGISPRFTLQGVRITQPTTGSTFDINSTREIRWLNAGFEAAAKARMFLSTDGGATFSPTQLFTPDTALNLQIKSWTVALGTAPTTNAVLKLTVTDSATAFNAYSLPFTLKGLKVNLPTFGTSWDLGATQNIQVQAAGAGNSVKMYYSPHGVTFDTANPIGEGVPIVDGINNLPWPIETFREPSTNARIRVDSVLTDATIVSDPFTVAGILVTDPSSVNIWAATETNHIEWIAVGTAENVTIELLDSSYSVVAMIATALTGASSYDWPTPLSAVGTDLRIRVTDTSGYVGISNPFKIVADPTLEVLQPVDGAFLKNGNTYQVVWTKAGGMPLTFEASYSFDNFATTNVISGVPVFSNNQYFLSWTLSDPAALGLAKIRVVNTTITSIQDTTANVDLVGNFRVGPPNGGERYFALKPTVVTWFTLGDVFNVDLYYSVDPLRAPGSWIKINQGGPVVGRGHNNSSQYFWSVADHRSSTVWLRVQDANYTQMFAANQEGPFDDCNGTFSIVYYQIQWHVYDNDTGLDLDRASVGDSSGWSESGLQSPIIHAYPYGNFDSVWSRELFSDKVVFDWLSEPERVIDVPMVKSDQAAVFNVRANFAYDSANRSFAIQSWLERGGQILATAAASVIKIYDSAGVLIKTIPNSAPLNGVFWDTWDVGATEIALGRTFNASEVFFAKVVINFSGVEYSSGLTFQLRQPADDSILQVIDVIEAATSNILDEVSGIGTMIGGVSNQVSGVSNQVTALSGQLGQGVADILGAVGTNRVLLTDQVIPGITDISNNLVNVYGPTITSTWDVVQLISGAVGGASILTRPLALVRDSTNTFLYRTANFDPSVVELDVYDSTGGLLAHYNMQRYGAVTGVYYANVVAAYAVDSCVIACSDPNASDRIVVDIVDATSGDLPNLMADVLASVTRMENSITNLSSLSGDMTVLVGVLNGMTNELQALTLAVQNLPDLGVLTNQLDSLEAAVLAIPDMSFLTNSINALATAVQNLPDLGVLTNQLDNLEAAVLAIPDFGSMSNQLATLEAAVLAIPDFGSMSNQLAGISLAVGGLTNLDVTAIDTKLTDLRTDLDTLIGFDLAGMQTSIDNILAALNVVEGTDVTGIESKLSALQSAIQGLEGADLTGVDAKLNTLQSTVAGLGSVDIAAVDRIESRLGAATDGSGADTFFGKLRAIEGSVDSVGVSAEGAKKNASSAKTQATDAASGISALKRALAAGDSEEASRQLVAIRQALMSAKAEIERIPDGVSLAQLQGELGGTRKILDELAASRGFTWLTGMEEEDLVGKGEGEGEANLNDLGTSVEAMQGNMEFLLKLLDEKAYKVEVHEQWLGVKE